MVGTMHCQHNLSYSQQVGPPQHAYTSCVLCTHPQAYLRMHAVHQMALHSLLGRCGRPASARSGAGGSTESAKPRRALPCLASASPTGLNGNAAAPLRRGGGACGRQRHHPDATCVLRAAASPAEQQAPPEPSTSYAAAAPLPASYKRLVARSAGSSVSEVALVQEVPLRLPGPGEASAPRAQLPGMNACMHACMW